MTERKTCFFSKKIKGTIVSQSIAGNSHKMYLVLTNDLCIIQRTYLTPMGSDGLFQNPSGERWSSL